MAKKKVMLFIVEGPTDETSLSTVLNRIFSSSTVKFQVVHGDVLTRDFTSSDKIVAAVWDQVKAFMGEIYKKIDICRIRWCSTALHRNSNSNTKPCGHFGSE